MHAFPFKKNSIFAAPFRCPFQECITPRAKTDKEFYPALTGGFVWSVFERGMVPLGQKWEWKVFACSLSFYGVTCHFGWEWVQKITCVEWRNWVLPQVTEYFHLSKNGQANAACSSCKNWTCIDFPCSHILNTRKKITVAVTRHICELASSDDIFHL